MNILKDVKKKIKNISFKKITAVFTALCFVFSIVSAQTAYAVMPMPNMSVPATLPAKALIPFNLGRITDAFYSNDGDIVINIQDLHSHEQTQRNISSILSILNNKFGLKDIYLEGATGTVNTQWLSTIKDNSVKQKVLNNLLASGRLTGGEYFAVQANKNDIIKGLEDKNLYTENFKILSDMYNKEAEIKSYISVLTNLFDKKSEQYISSENKKVNRIIENYKQEKIKTDKYIELLLKKAKETDINLSKYGTIIKFAQIISKQKAFDVKKLNDEIANLLNELKERLSFQEYKSLTEKASKKEFEVEFYFDLLKKAKDLDLLSDKKYKNTNAFFEYLVLNQNINTINLANEEKLFVKELRDKLAQTQAEKDIYFLQQSLEKLSQYLTNKMTAKDYEEFSESITKFKLLWEKYIYIDNLTSLTEYFDLADTFYKNNVERNRVFIKNVFGKKANKPVNGLRIKNSLINHKDKVLEAISNGRKIHVVITGGFHTYGFNKLLEDENINYIVITPNVTGETTKAESLYKNIFKEEYDITNTTFANMPVSQIIALLNKGKIEDIQTVGNSVQIKFEGIEEPFSLDDLSEETTEEALTPEQADIATETILGLQDLLKSLREVSRSGADFDIFTKLNDLEALADQITNIELKNKFIEQINTVRENYSDMFDQAEGKMILPSTKRFLNIFFGFIKNEGVKNRIMSVGAAVLENTFLFPIILFSPTTFTLLHFRKNSRQNIKKVLNELDELNQIKNLLSELDTLSKQGQEQTQAYKEQLQNLSRQIGRINKNIKNVNIDELNREIQRREAFLNKIGYTPILNGTIRMKNRGFGFMIFAGVMMLIGFMGTIETSSTFAEAFSTIGSNIKFVFYTLAGAFGFGFYEAHIAHNLKIDSKVSKARQALKDSLYDLVNQLPNDVTYATYDNLEESELYVIFSDILEAFDYDFFEKDYIKSTDGEAEPLTFLEILKGITARGEGIDSEEYNYNIETIIDFFENMSDEQKNTIIENIDATLQYNSLSKEEKELLKNYRNNILNFKKKYWKLNILESDDKQGKEKRNYEVNINGKKYFVYAVSFKQAFNSVLARITGTNRLEIYKLHESLGYNAYRDNLDREMARLSFKTKKERKEYEERELEKFYKRFIREVLPENTTRTVLSKPTRKLYSNKQRFEDEELFRVEIPGINNSAELEALQYVYAKSPKQAIRTIIRLISDAAEKGTLVGGMYEGLTFSEKNIYAIEQAVVKNNPDLSKLIKNNDHPINKAPQRRNNITPKEIPHQMTIGEKEYIVEIPEFNDTTGLERYQHVFATDEDSAIEKAVDAIIQAKQRKELIGGYYSYIVINDRKNSEGIKNRDIIIEEIKRSGTAKITEITEQQEEKPAEKYKGLTETEAFQEIADYVGTDLKTIRELFAPDKGKSESEQRGEKFAREIKLGNGQAFRFDFSKTNIDEELLKRFAKLLEEVKFEERRDAMLSGETYNLTEQRSVLHSALRNIITDKNGNLKAKSPIYVKGNDVMPDIIKVLNKMKEFSDKIITGEWRGINGDEIENVVSIGIGGSDLGPRMATEALSTFNQGRNVHFVSNVDPNDIDSVLNGLNLDPAKTLFIIESKTFTTEETLANANAAKKWVTDRLGTDPEVIKKHFVAVSTNKEKVAEFGIDTENMFEFWDWVGGRFSVWSAVGLPLMCSVGFNNFIEFLGGANDIDENFKNNDITQNIPALMAILNVLERNFLDRNAYAILPYNRYLKAFTSHIQQVYMESLGKSVDIYGNRITDHSTGSEIYGTAGTDAQHSYLQEHHQGTDIIPVDFIGFAQTSDNITDETLQESHTRLLANMLAQASAMAFGRTYEETVAKLMEEGADEQTAREDAKAKIFDGNRPSTIMMFDKLTPRTLGASIALYEDMVATLGIIWNINAFDQMGVQLGKVNAKETFKGLSGKEIETDSSTKGNMAFVAAAEAGKTASVASGTEIPAKIATNIASSVGKDKAASQQEQTNLQNLISQLTYSQNDKELKDAIDKMLKAGFKEKYVEKLLSQYFDLRNGNIPNAVYSKTEQIKFGTAGVRGIMGEEVDFLDMVIITQAISNVISEIAAKQNIEPKDVKILVGGDSRFLSKQFAEIVSKILAANGINVVISSDDIPSPTISYYTKADGFTLSINITASHNPKEHNGYKITLGDGGQAGTDVTTMIENEIKSIQDQLAVNADPGIKIVTDSEQISSIDVKNTFIKAFVEMITGVFGMKDNTSLNKFKQKAKEWTVVVDPKNGATKRYYAEILKLFGFNVVMINDTVDPTFGGQKPEPSFENTKQLREKVKSITEENLLGISTDVDGDRFAVVDKNGNFVTANEIGTILLNFRLQTLFDDLISDLNAAQGNKAKQNEILKKFLERKLIVPRNCATTHVLDDLAANLTSEYYDKLKNLDLDSELVEQFKNCVDVKEVNVGFKYFAQAKHDAEDNGDLFLLGVESSGGISIAEWIYDKCGFLANLMLLFVLVENGKQPSDVLSDVYSRIEYAPQGIETTIKFREIVAEDSTFDTPEQISAEAKKRQEKLMSTITQLKENENLASIRNLFIGIDKNLVIKEIRNNDGIKIVFENGAWLLIRPSGTEPIVRIFDETKGNEKLSKDLVEFVTGNGGQDLIDTIEKVLETKMTPFKANVTLFEMIIENSVKALQRLTYSILYKDNMEYTIVADATDFARITKANELSKQGVKVNLVLLGETNLIQEASSRISTSEGDLAFCLTSKPNENLTVYGYDDNSYGQTINIRNVTKQDALMALLQHVNDNSDKSVKILDLPENLGKDIVATDIGKLAEESFSVVGIGKTVLKLFTDALGKKLNQKASDDMLIKPSVVATNLSAEQIDTFGQEDIDRLEKQGVTAIIISANDKLLQDKSQTLKDLLQAAHDKGLKVMFSFDLHNITTKELESWISTFNDRFQQFKENDGIDGLQIDLSQNGVSAKTNEVLSLLSTLSKEIKEHNTGAYLAVKMPSDVYPEFLINFKNDNIKLVVDYDSPLLSVGKDNDKIINISADKNGTISMEQLSAMFQNNNIVSMMSLDFSILEAIGDEENFKFNDGKMTIVKFITSIFEATPEGQRTKGINNGRNFAISKDSVINEGVMRRLYEMYTTDNFNIPEIAGMLETTFKENISKYELKGFVEGLLQATELKMIQATDISFDKKEYTNMLMQALVEYRITSQTETFKELPISDDVNQILNVENFRDEFKQEIERVHSILNNTGTVEDREDLVIHLLSSLKDNPELNSQERAMVLEGLLSLLLGYATPNIDMSELTNEESIANIKAILRAA